MLYTLFRATNEITKITRLLFRRLTLMNFKTQDQKVWPRYEGRIKKKKSEKSGRWHGIFCAGREKVKITEVKWFHILGNTVIIFADVTSCSPCILVKLWLISLSRKYTGCEICIFCHRDEHYFLSNLKSRISRIKIFP